MFLKGEMFCILGRPGTKIDINLVEKGAMCSYTSYMERKPEILDEKSYIYELILYSIRQFRTQFTW